MARRRKVTMKMIIRKTSKWVIVSKSLNVAAFLNSVINKR
jgi:hypothetical protein